MKPCPTFTWKHKPILKGDWLSTSDVAEEPAGLKDEINSTECLRNSHI
jgi:hypothetical protein